MAMVMPSVADEDCTMPVSTAPMTTGHEDTEHDNFAGFRVNCLEPSEMLLRILASCFIGEKPIFHESRDRRIPCLGRRRPWRSILVCLFWRIDKRMLRCLGLVSRICRFLLLGSSL